MSQTEENSIEKRKRIFSLDIFKGLTVILMVYANTLNPYENVPAWSKHAGDYGLTFVDVIAPLFVFMVALSMNVAYKKRLLKIGRKKTILRYLRRFFIFIGLGLGLTLYISPEEFYLRWGTFQVLGVSGLFLLLIIEFKPFIKLSFAGIFMILHQIILLTPLNTVVYNSLEGGVTGVFSWASMMILSSFLATGLNKHNNLARKYLLYGGLISLIIGILLSPLLEISRPFISVPYILISVGVASITYYFLYYIFEESGYKLNFLRKEKVLSVVGKNAFILYLLHVLFAYMIYSFVPIDAPFILILSLSFAHIFLIWLIAFFMNKVEMFIVI